jgi:hypothetical protein
MSVSAKPSRKRRAFYRDLGTSGVLNDGHMPIELPEDYEDFKASVVFDMSQDSQGVYEVWWAANSWYPALPLSRRLAIAENVVSDLLAEGRVTLVRGKWIGPDHEREAVGDAQSTLLDWATWVPQDESVVWLLQSD